MTVLGQKKRFSFELSRILCPICEQDGSQYGSNLLPDYARNKGDIRNEELTSMWKKRIVSLCMEMRKNYLALVFNNGDNGNEVLKAKLRLARDSYQG